MTRVAIRTPVEIEAMAAAGAIVGDTLAMVRQMAAPGVRVRAIALAAEAMIRGRGAVPTFKGYRGFPAPICTSIDSEAVHGLPGWRKLRSGQLFKVDCGATLNGWVGDAAITIPIGQVDPERLDLMHATRAALQAALAAARAGATLGDLGHAVQQVAEAGGYGIARELAGHGVGRVLHEDPQVPNFGEAGSGPTLQVGWCLAIEPILNLGADDLLATADGWTVRTADGQPSAHFEHSIAIAEGQPRILTLTSDGAWP
jgi:methionyl aminopeptidase